MKLKILVEGWTEYRFAKTVLKPYLNGMGYGTTPYIIETSPKHRGGITGYNKFRENIMMLKPRAEPCVITTMIDFYRLPKDFPGMSFPENKSDEAKVLRIERSLLEDMPELGPYFVPNIMLHEFEALLFSDIYVTDKKLKVNRSSKINELEEIMEIYTEPENINTTNAPSFYLKNLYPGYRKVAEGVPVAEKIGLEIMRKKCRHFDFWIENLEEIMG